MQTSKNHISGSTEPFLMSEGSLESYGCLVSEKMDRGVLCLRGKSKICCIYARQFSKKKNFEFFLRLELASRHITTVVP